MPNTKQIVSVNQRLVDNSSSSMEGYSIPANLRWKLVEDDGEPNKGVFTLLCLLLVVIPETHNSQTIRKPKSSKSQ